MVCSMLMEGGDGAERAEIFEDAQASEVCANDLSDVIINDALFR
jgi:hypothetical protein